MRKFKGMKEKEVMERMLRLEKEVIIEKRGRR